MTLILKRDPVGQNPEDYSVLEDGVVIGRIFKVPIAPPDRPWMWASGHTATSAALHTATSQRGKPRWRHSPRAGDWSKLRRA
ncbi:MAG TPA: hypothetical protein VH439_06195 [Gemmatimonadales bacterium]|jgi:hypothetical protein